MRPFYPTGHIDFYARRVIRDLGLNQPPVDVDSILKYFGLKLRYWDDVIEDEVLAKYRIALRSLPGFLLYIGDAGIIFMNKDDNMRRRRFSILHECGHFDIPWHRGKNFVCNLNTTIPTGLAPIERQAFEYAAYLMFPNQLFYDDLMSTSVSLQSISELSDRYQASFEATAIKYTSLSPELCSVFYIRSNGDGDRSEFPHSIRYMTTSRNLRRYWHERRKVRYCELISQAFRSGQPQSGDISASIFDDSRRQRFRAEARPYGNDQVCLLLHMANPQKRLE